MIETKRLLIRKFESKDFKQLYNLDSNPLVHKYLYNSPMKSYGEAKEYIQAQLNQYENYGVGRLAVLDKNGFAQAFPGCLFIGGVLGRSVFVDDVVVLVIFVLVAVLLVIIAFTFFSGICSLCMALTVTGDKRKGD